jgi:hypothetical protein
VTHDEPGNRIRVGELATATEPCSVKHATVEAARVVEMLLPEAGKSPHFESASFQLRRKVFVTIPPDEERAHVLVDEDETASAVERFPQA